MFVCLFVEVESLPRSLWRDEWKVEEKTCDGDGWRETSARLGIISYYDTPKDQKQWAADCLINWELTLQYALNYDSLLSLDPVWK